MLLELTEVKMCCHELKPYDNITTEKKFPLFANSQKVKFLDVRNYT